MLVRRIKLGGGVVIRLQDGAEIRMKFERDADTRQARVKVVMDQPEGLDITFTDQCPHNPPSHRSPRVKP